MVASYSKPFKTGDIIYESFDIWRRCGRFGYCKLYNNIDCPDGYVVDYQLLSQVRPIEIHSIFL